MGLMSMAVFSNGVKAMAQEHIIFECTQCKNRGYHSTKNKKKHPDKLELKKFCKSCKKHTVHKEIK